MLGNRYGFHPLPPEIQQTEFEILREVAEDEAAEGWKLLDSWFELDKNAVPPLYVLQVRYSYYFYTKDASEIVFLTKLVELHIKN